MRRAALPARGSPRRCPKVLLPWLSLAAVAAFGADASAAALARELRRWAAEECLLLSLGPQSARGRRSA